MIKIQAEANVPTDHGNFRMIAFSEESSDWMPHMAIIAENTDLSKPVNVRFHSECITGEVFHSQKCECGQQLDAAMKYMHENGGIIVYLRQEGRNIGIINKLKAYSLQEKGFDTVAANLELGLPADDRNFAVAIEILNILQIKDINLLTNNPEKVKFVRESNINLNSRIPLQIPASDASRGYLQTKKDYFGHLLDDEV
ncbi:GTP cyclohydrolase II [Chryseobacterium chendengshani]|uniref:GTP cyclohydrolase II n=1 Tax=unclassified Chryseobacterium TaxID=2593645 RepID=UPI001C642CFC|nr:MULTISPECIES: GTP cyclohydrolase II [unclassified Chryseobacterium]MBW7676883.1 GTP cyclohydrolase II [Chryseobacterium sp. LJ756]MBW8524607.1 GTP cyclohydrolase II [Chryseobacterium sp. LJ668]QYK17330.1 GTP cyclohydrolase II [Chryseobacterium sp. LJ668]